MTVSFLKFTRNLVLLIFFVAAVTTGIICGYKAFTWIDKNSNPTNINDDKNSYVEKQISEMLQLCYYNLTEDEADFYAMMFNKYSGKYGIDWKIYPAIIAVESNFDPAAISSKKAKGIMQMMDSTFKEMCAKNEIFYMENRTIYNDVLNVKMGLQYLSFAVKTKGLERGVKSYIGGPGYSNTNQDVKEYWVRFSAEYAKIISIENDYQSDINAMVNKALNN